MSRELDFRNHRNVALRRIFHDFAHLVLGIETAIRCLVERSVLIVFPVGILADDGAATH